MVIFTDNIVTQARNRYRNLSPSQQYRLSSVYGLVVSAASASQRQELEQWCICLPTRKRKRLSKDAADLAPGLIHTYHELAVGVKLKELGFAIEYEQTVKTIRTRLKWLPLSGPGNDDTPDWFIQATATTPPFIAIPTPISGR